MKALAWVGYSVGLLLLMNGQPKIGGVLFLGGVLIHWRWWIIVLPVGIAAFFIGANWKKDC